MTRQVMHGGRQRGFELLLDAFGNWWSSDERDSRFRQLHVLG